MMPKLIMTVVVFLDENHDLISYFDYMFELILIFIQQYPIFIKKRFADFIQIVKKIDYKYVTNSIIAMIVCIR